MIHLSSRSLLEIPTNHLSYKTFEVMILILTGRIMALLCSTP